MLKICCAIFCFLSSIAFANDYTVAPLAIESLAIGQWYASEINNKGQILGYHYDNGIFKLFIYDSKTGINTFIDAKGQYLRPLKINNAGQVLGCDHNQKPFIWSKVLGIRWLEIPNSINVSAVDLNDLGQIIGSYFSQGSNTWRPYLWDYGVVTDMGIGSEFSQAIEALGYHVMSIELSSVNNKGELAGNFAFGKFNEKTKKYIVEGYKAFFWNGDLNILPLPNDFQPTIKINNHGIAMINSDHCYIWDIDNGLRPILDFQGRALNDSLTVFGYSSNGAPGLWKNNCIYPLADLLGISDISNMAPYLSDSYDLERIDSFNSLNNKGQIPCVGYIWGDPYPCLLEPIIQENKVIDLSLFMDSYKNSDDFDRGSTLRYAIRHDFHEIASYLISYGPNAYLDMDKCLFLAAEKGNLDAINQMVEIGWNTNIKSLHDNRSLLHHAARMGQAPICQFFIDHDRALDDKDKWGQSSLHLAIELAINAKTVEEKKTLCEPFKFS